MNSISTPEPSLSSRAMLCSLSISMWSARKHDRHIRQVTKGVDPKGRAVWSLKELQEQLAKYFYEVYDSMDHPALGQSPREAYEAGFAMAGERAHRVIPYDREFLIYTMPTTPCPQPEEGRPRSSRGGA
jgi:hypothetical protein